VTTHEPARPPPRHNPGFGQRAACSDALNLDPRLTPNQDDRGSLTVPWGKT